MKVRYIDGQADAGRNGVAEVQLNPGALVAAWYSTTDTSNGPLCTVTVLPPGHGPMGVGTFTGDGAEEQARAMLAEISSGFAGGAS